MRARTLIALTAGMAFAVLAVFASAAPTRAPEIRWNGPGIPTDLPFGADTALPVIVANTTAGRVPRKDPKLYLLLQPRPDESAITWSVTPLGRVHLTDVDPGADAAASPFQMLPLSGKVYGPSRISATITKPHRRVLSIEAYSYQTTGVGCYGAFPGGIRFDTNGAPVAAASPAQSDIYETGPANTKDRPLSIGTGCSGAFIDPKATDFTVHIPGGATVLKNTTKTYFPFVESTAWNGDLKEFDQFAFGDMLLIKTHEGRIVKILTYPITGPAVSGAYIMSDKAGHFADALYFTKDRSHS